MKPIKLIIHLATWNIVPFKVKFGLDGYTSYRWLCFDLEVYTIYPKNQ